jgi:hypothetical protein
MTDRIRKIQALGGQMGLPGLGDVVALTLDPDHVDPKETIE